MTTTPAAPTPIVLDRTPRPESAASPNLTTEEADNIIGVLRNPDVPLHLRTQLLKYATGSRALVPGMSAFVEALTRHLNGDPE